MLEIPSPNRSNNISIKLLVLAGLVFVSWVASLLVLGVVDERQGRQAEAILQTAEQWSRAQTVAGPVLAVPVERSSVTTEGEVIVRTDTLFVTPKTVHYDGSIASEELTRGIYQVPVYNATVYGKGVIDISDIEPEEGVRLLWDRATLSLNVSDTRGISSVFALRWNDAEYQFEPSSHFVALGGGVHTSVPVDPAQAQYTFSFTLPLKGSEQFRFLPLGESTTVSLESDWPTPSFQGAFLPIERTLDAGGFSATWEVASYGKDLPQYWYERQVSIGSEELREKEFGVALHQAVDLYTMIDRATKYAILFICLTFLTFFMYEVLSGLRIHPIQYLLVGMAIALFYLLLLSLAEQVGFLIAYVAATAATTVLVTSYCLSVLHARMRALFIGSLLLALYTYLYILLQLEALSLLFGSVLLFGVLSTVMFLTRDIDWYSLKKSS